MRLHANGLFALAAGAATASVYSFCPSCTRFAMGSTTFMGAPSSFQNKNDDNNRYTSSASETKIKMSTVTEETKAESFQFEAEVGRVMEIIINSLYSDRDVFLRELVSNAADACDKRRFLSLTSDEGGSAEPSIKIRGDAEAKTLTIEDSGVGMTREELIKNLGQIAQSGTKKFVEALGEGKGDVNLIGQFGVGFYSGFLVADKVTVQTKSFNDAENSKIYTWESDASSGYTISDDDTGVEPFEAGFGTRLILSLKEDALDYAETTKLNDLLVKYSEFIEFPISLWKEKTEYKQVPDEEANKDLGEDEEPKMKTVPETTTSYERMNNQKPIWLRSPKEVEAQEYADFYKSAFKAAYDEPLAHTHFVLEGQVECKALLYVPGSLPFELSRDMFDENAKNMRLYVKRVFINDNFEDLIPRWLKFVRGVVDSDDLPLNVGREILQKSKVLSVINKRLVRKSIDMIGDIAKDEDESKYIMFWNNFGKYMKVGIIEDDANRDSIAPLLRMFSSKSGEEYTSLDKYIETMPDTQKDIYYVTGDGKAKASMNPVIEKLSSRGYEVLYMVEPLDEIMIQSLNKYKDFNVVDATKEGAVKFNDDEQESLKKKQEELNEQFKAVREYLEATLGDKIQKAEISPLLTESPAALVQGQFGVSPTMERYMKAQSVAMGMGEDDLGGVMGSMNKAVLELNPNHPIIKELDAKVKTDKDSEDTKNYALLMYDVASLTSGYEMSETKSFAQRVMSMMAGPVSTMPEAVIEDAEAVESVVEESATEEVSSDDNDSSKAVEPEVL